MTKEDLIDRIYFAQTDKDFFIFQVTDAELSRNDEYSFEGKTINAEIIENKKTQAYGDCVKLKIYPDEFSDDDVEYQFTIDERYKVNGEPYDIINGKIIIGNKSYNVYEYDIFRLTTDTIWVILDKNLNHYRYLADSEQAAEIENAKEYKGGVEIFEDDLKEGNILIAELRSNYTEMPYAFIKVDSKEGNSYKLSILKPEYEEALNNNPRRGFHSYLITPSEEVEFTIEATYDDGELSINKINEKPIKSLKVWDGRRRQFSYDTSD